MVDKVNLLQHWEKQLSEHRAKLQEHREKLVAAARDEPENNLLAINEELLHLVDELLTTSSSKEFIELPAGRGLTAQGKFEVERQQLFIELEKERNLWQTTVDSMLDPVTVCNAQGQAIYMNKAYERLLQMEISQGLELEQHADYYQIYHPDGTPFDARDLPLQKAALENKNIQNVEIVQYSATGKKYYLIWNAAPLHDSQGAVIGAVAVGRDITAQRAAEAEQARLREEAEEGRHTLDALMNYIPEGITIADAPDVQIRMISNFGRELIGLDFEEIVGRPRSEWWKITNPETGKPATIDQMPLSRVIWNGKTITDEEWLLENARGERISILSNAGPIRNREGEIIGGISAWRDITERKRAEAALHESQERYRLLVDAIANVVWRTTSDGKTMFGIAGDGAVETGNRDGLGSFQLGISHPDDQAQTEEAWKAAIANKRLYDIEHRHLDKDGKYHWYHCRAVPRCDDDGNVIEWIGISTDISDRKNAEQAIQEYSEQLRQYSEELEARVRDRTEELVNLQRRLIENIEAERLWVSQELHDGPMQEIYGLMYNLSALKDGPGDFDWRSELAPYVEMLKQINDNLRKVTRELRPTSLTPFGLERAIREHGERFDQEHPELSISLDLMEDMNLLPEHVRLSLFRIYQTALMNVIRHAEARQVSIRFSFDEQNVFLEIQDDGKGFVVPKRIRTLARQGHFGLAGAMERAEAMGGKIEVDSAPGKGTKLRVTVPLNNQ